MLCPRCVKEMNLRGEVHGVGLTMRRRDCPNCGHSIITEEKELSPVVAQRLQEAARRKEAHAAAQAQEPFDKLFAGR
jgi:hypothetical protein